MPTLSLLDDNFESITEIPQRSRLICLEPVGIGTAFQESLLSLLIRTCRAHAVNPRLMVKKVFPQVEPEFSRLSSAIFFQRMSGPMNGLNKYAELFVSAMEQLTGHSDLHRLTMLSWQSLFPHNGQGLLARYPRWCPECLYEMAQAGRVVAIPLIWSLEPYQHCHIHQTPLECRCPACSKMQPFIPAYPELSICNYCRHSLGVKREPQKVSDFHTWVAEAIADMVCRHSDASFLPSAERSSEFLIAQVAHQAEGNRTAFCRALGLNKYAISGWLNKGERPSFTQFLTVCYGTKTWPVQVFDHLAEAMPSSGLRFPAAKLKNRKRCPRPSKERRGEIEKYLQRCLVVSAKRPLHVIAGELGLTQDGLRYWFPDHCRTISEQYHEVAIRISHDRRMMQSEWVREIIEKIREEGGLISRRRIDKHLRDRGLSISQPHLIETFRTSTESVP